MSRNMKKKIVLLPYDFDTAIGTNNEGSLVFSYNLEDIDQVSNADVFNGQQSVLWKNLREMFYEELKAMYQQLRSQNKLSYALTEQAFEEHQEKWPEALFNEDSWFKYLAPLEEKGSEAYLAMLQGSKAEQRKWWLYNRFKYMDSKYNAGDALTDVITLRGYAKANVVITPYADIYPAVKFGSYLVQTRGERNTASTMVCPLDNVNDTEIYIYSASQLASVGDLSGLKVGYAEFTYATRLQELKLGDSSQSYDNGNLETLYLGQNKLLKKLDVRNCSGLGTGDQKSVDISGCSNIEEVYFDGTSILGVSLPNGGFLKKLHLPGTITNLTIRNQTMITEFECDDYSNISTLFLENTSDEVDIAEIMADVATGCRVRLFNFYWEFESINDVNDFLDLFDGMTGMDQNGNNLPTPQIFATVHVPSATGDQIDAIHANFPDITVESDVATYNLKYYNMEGTTLLYTESVVKGQDGTWNSQPTHEPSEQYNYTFAGWSRYKNSLAADSTARTNITNNRNVYAAYTTSVRTFTVKFYSGSTLLQTVNNVAYGSSAAYTGATPTKEASAQYTYSFIGWNANSSASEADPDAMSNITSDKNIYAIYSNTLRSYTITFVRAAIDGGGTLQTQTVAYGTVPTYTGSIPTTTQQGYAFKGWTPTLTAVTGDATYTAAFEEIAELTRPYIDRTMINIESCSATGIRSYAFFDRSIRTAIFQSATYVGSYAFASCPNLSSISFPHVESIYDRAFYSDQFSIASFPAATLISSYAFQNCYRINTLSFPEATTIGNYAFGNCGSLTTISFPKVTSIGNAAFSACSSMTAASFPLAETIGQSAFANCRKLVEASFPAATVIMSSAFYNCYSLTTASFPAATSFGSYVFQNCTSLNTVILGNTSIIASLGKSSFSGANSAIIYVPDALVASYKAAMNWSTYASRIKGISELPS